MVPVTDIDQLDMDGTYTYADYLLWKFKDRVELLKGRIFKMSPAPNTYHQCISRNLTIKLGVFFENHNTCNLFAAPFDVRIPNKNDQQIFTVVQPDLCVICDPSKIDDKGGIGAPDLIIEILSPGNSKKEMKYKFDLYEEAGVQEYWIVQPEYNAILINVLTDGKYTTLRPIVQGNEITSALFPDLRIQVDKIFDYDKG